MPLVQIDMMEGRDARQIQAMITAVSHAIADALPAPIESVRVIVREMEPHQYGVGGVPLTVIRQQRAAAAADGEPAVTVT